MKHTALSTVFAVRIKLDLYVIKASNVLQLRAVSNFALLIFFCCCLINNEKHIQQQEYSPLSL